MTGSAGVRRAGAALAVPCAVIGCWQLAAWSGVLNLQFLPAPHRIGVALFTESTHGDLVADTAHTLTVAVSATAIAALAGGALGTAIGLLPALRTWTAASVDFLRAVPAVALMPAAVLLLGPRQITELLLAAFAATWPAVLATATAAAAVPARLRDVARVLRLSRAATVRTIILPAMLPGWLAATRVSTIIALHVTVLAEMVISPTGLGGGLVESLHGLNPPRMWAYALTCGVLGYLGHATLRRGVRAALPGNSANLPQGSE